MSTTTTQGPEHPRATKYGLPLPGQGAELTNNTTKPQQQKSKIYPMASKAKASTPALPPKPYKTYGTQPALPKFKPISDEVTVYGAKKYRTPTRKNQFTGYTGTRQTAVILDIDGTLQGWGQAGDKDVMKWVQKQYKAGHLLIVVTARDEGMYDTSFNWLMRNLPFPFIGPFCRADDDPRFASEFKRELCEGLESIYQIVGAADDNKFVNDMWKQWAIDHFEVPEDFDLLECDTYASYSDWRYDLDSKGNSLYDNQYGTSKWGSTTATSYYDQHKGEHWVNGGVDPITKKWTQGHYEKDVPVLPAVTTPHRPAGVSRWEKNDADPTPGGDPVDIANDPRWAYYVAQRAKGGAYLGVDLHEVEDVIEGEVVVDPTAAEVAAFDDALAMQRGDLLAIVSYGDPNLSPAELEEFTDYELAEMAGLCDPIGFDNRWEDTDWEDVVKPLFTVEQLVSQGEVVDAERRDELILERLTLEEDLYANDPNITKLEIAAMSYDKLTAAVHRAMHRDMEDEAQA